MSGAKALVVALALTLHGAAGRAQMPAADAPAPRGMPVVVGDGIPVPLTDQPGDAARGRAQVGSRTQGMCLLCHSGPREIFPDERTPGNIAGSLAGAGARWSVPQLRLRLVDARRVQPDTPMPAYFRVDPATEAERRVGRAWRGKPLLEAQQVEDVVAFLATLP